MPDSPSESASSRGSSPNFPRSAADVKAILENAGGGPLRFTKVSVDLRRKAGKGDDPESERYGDVKAYRGLLDLKSRGLAKKLEAGWVLS